MSASKGSDPQAPREVYQFRIALEEIVPEIWRRIQVPTAYTFWDLHVAIQDAMGWDDCHLHEFRLPNPKSKHEDRIGIPDDDDPEDEATLAGWEVPLTGYFSRKNTTAHYLYDFGDDWQHRIVLEDVVAVRPGLEYPVCLEGARACPPEESGGSPGYDNFLEAIRDPEHEEHDAYLEWIGGAFDPEDFDPARVEFDDPKARFHAAFAESEDDDDLDDDDDDERGRDEPDPKALRATFREVVRTQLESGEPPELRQTHDRLLAAGYPKAEVWDMLSTVVATEMFEVLRDRRPFDRERYARLLAHLPALPCE
jgi:hypothetical protein